MELKSPCCWILPSWNKKTSNKIPIFIVENFWVSWQIYQRVFVPLDCSYMMFLIRIADGWYKVDSCRCRFMWESFENNVWVLISCLYLCLPFYQCSSLVGIPALVQIKNVYGVKGKHFICTGIFVGITLFSVI